MALSKVNPNFVEQTPYGIRNLIINGAMQVAQRGTSFSGQGANAAPYFTDRWYAYSGGTSAGRFTATQEAITDLSGFTTALKLDCTTADTSIGADEQLSIIQPVEAQNLQRLKFGTSDAVPLTYSFYAKANAAKTYIAELYAIDGTAQSQSHAFNVTTSWQRFEITFSATGANAATINNDIGVGLYVNINLHAGSNLTSGTINSTWAAATQANRMVGCGSFYSSTDNTFFMTGAQLEVGSTAKPFEHRSYGEELSLCQRYYFAFIDAGSGNEAWITTATCYNTTNAYGGVRFPVSMRAIPTLRQYTGTDVWQLYNNLQSDRFDAFTMFGAYQTTKHAAMIYNSDAVAITAGQSGNFQGGNSACYMHFDAEL